MEILTFTELYAVMHDSDWTDESIETALCKVEKDMGGKELPMHLLINLVYGAIKSGRLKAKQFYQFENISPEQKATMSQEDIDDECVLIEDLSPEDCGIDGGDLSINDVMLSVGV